jgi:hypothetical protein
MIKLIYKSLLIAVISGSLTAGNFVYALGPAQNTEDPAAANINAGATTNTGNSNPSQTQNWVKDKDGTLAQQEKHDFKGVKGNDMLSSITMLVIGVIGTRMAIAYNPKTTDVYVAAAGAAAFIAGEVMSNLKFSGEIKDMSVDITKRVDGKPNNEQIEILNKLKKSYEDAKGATQTKRMLQMAAAAGFGVAAGIAVYKAFTDKTQGAQCVAALTMAQGQLETLAVAQAASPEPVTKALAPKTRACSGALKAWQAQFSAKEASVEPPKLSTGVAAEDKAQTISLTSKDPTTPIVCTGETIGIISASASACKVKIATEKADRTATPAVETGFNHHELIEKILIAMNGIISPRQKA